MGVCVCESKGVGIEPLYHPDFPFHATCSLCHGLSSLRKGKAQMRKYPEAFEREVDMMAQALLTVNLPGSQKYVEQYPFYGFPAKI